MDTINKLQQQLQMAQEQIKNLSGDLQTANRESVASRKRTEVEKFKTQLKSYEADTKAKNQISMDKIKSAVNLETEKMRIANQSAAKELQKGNKK